MPSTNQNINAKGHQLTPAKLECMSVEYSVQQVRLSATLVRSVQWVTAIETCLHLVPVS
jgi:hypothetical protein